tara:strand:- start:8561 stop:8878 length:318 start_codon:yes stop_codon:yes gene_type:complete
MNKYYEQYLNDHSEPKVKLMHFIGQIVTIAYLVWSICRLIEWPSLISWIQLSITPFVVYPFAVGGHLLFGPKGNKPSFCKMPFLKAKICDIKMFVDIIRGKFRIW